LIEVLGNDYEVLHAYLGDGLFDTLAGDYIAAHPSTFRNVRWFGGKLALPFGLWLMKRTMLGNPFIKPWNDLAALADDFVMEEFVFGSWYRQAAGSISQSGRPAGLQIAIHRKGCLLARAPGNADAVVLQA